MILHCTFSAIEKIFVEHLLSELLKFNPLAKLFEQHFGELAGVLFCLHVCSLCVSL